MKDQEGCKLISGVLSPMVIKPFIFPEKEIVQTRILSQPTHSNTNLFSFGICRSEIICSISSTLIFSLGEVTL